MVEPSDWPERREWYLRWGRASNRERLAMMWHEHRPLGAAILIALGFVGGWWFWSYIVAVASWFGRYSEEIRNLMLAVGVGAAIFGGWVALQRSRTDRMRAETDRLRQVTEGFAKAVELLAHEERSVRLGAIYALERIARENRDEHWPIMETLTAYVRERSGSMVRPHIEPPSDEPPRPSPIDVAAVFTVLGRRRLDHEERTGPGPRRLNLASTYLVDVTPDPSPQRHFSRANLSGSDLTDADLTQANLQEARLLGATLQGASLVDAQLERAAFQGANLACAQLDGAKARGARFGKANLRRAMLVGADLRGANLEGTILQNAYLAEADLSTARGLTQEQLNSATGDENTKIPEGLTRPAHWTS